MVRSSSRSASLFLYVWWTYDCISFRIIRNFRPLYLSGDLGQVQKAIDLVQRAGLMVWFRCFLAR